MTRFAYEAHAADGRLVRGMLEAAGRREALRQIGAHGAVPLSLAEIATPSAFGRSTPSADQLTHVFAMLASLLESGMTLLTAIEVIAEQSHPRVQNLLRDLHSRIADGATLSSAMARHSRLFDEVAISMVRAGEDGGFAAESLRHLASLREKQAARRANLISAVAYPALLLVVGICVCVAMIVWFVPKFEPLFERLRGEGALPWSTVSLLATSRFAADYGIWVCFALVAVFIAFQKHVRSGSGRVRWDRLKLRLPLVGQIVADAALSVFLRLLSTLIVGGVPLLDSLRIAKGASGNKAMEGAIQEAENQVATGSMLAEPLKRSGMFPPEIVELIRIGERTNRLGDILSKAATEMDVRTARRLALFTKLLEPALMIVLAVIIGWMIVALLMPVFLSSGRFH